jgi:hypothetical protein
MTPRERYSRVLAVSVPPAAERDFEGIALEEGRTKSELFREMLRVYTAWRATQRFESLQRYGAARAHEFRLDTEADIGRLVQAVRKAPPGR